VVLAADSVAAVSAAAVAVPGNDQEADKSRNIYKNKSLTSQVARRAPNVENGY